MRIRQVRPEFWSDETIGGLSDAEKLFYIGLWTVADDAGWLVWVPAQISALLYPYKRAQRRRKDVEAWVDRLAGAGRVKLYDCGCLEIPSLPRHQRVAGTLNTKAKDAHEAHVAPRGYVGLRAATSRSPSGSVEGGSGRGYVEERSTRPIVLPPRATPNGREPRSPVDPERTTA